MTPTCVEESVGVPAYHDVHTPYSGRHLCVHMDTWWRAPALKRTCEAKSIVVSQYHGHACPPRYESVRRTDMSACVRVSTTDRHFHLCTSQYHGQACQSMYESVPRTSIFIFCTSQYHGQACPPMYESIPRTDMSTYV
ncbi:hypothetical protein Bbelb_156480 [Branchiostoma belcheri]|nr:hypothetical protein Bbelb_156480 [Branchiostoma belcheri]